MFDAKSDFVSMSNDVIVCHEHVVLLDFLLFSNFDVFYP